MDGIYNLFGTAPSYLPGLLGEDEARRLQEQSRRAGLAGLGLSLLSGGGQNLGQMLAQGVAAGQQASRNAYEQAVKDKMLQQQLAEQQQARQEALAARQILPTLIRPAQQKMYGEIGEVTTVGQPQLDVGALSQLFATSPNIAAKILPSVEAFRKFTAPERIKLGAEETLTEIGPDGEPRVVARGAGKPEKLTSDVQNYQEAVRQGFKGSFFDYQTALKRAGAQQVNLPPAEKAFDTKAGGLIAETYGDVMKQGTVASRNLGTLTRLESLLDKTGGGLVTALQSFAGQYGIKSKGSGDIEAAQAVISRLVPEQRAPGSGNMSDRDIVLFKAALPNLINTPEGNRKILEAMRGIVEYDIKAAQIAKDVLTRKITQEEGDNRLGRLRNPLESFRSSARLKYNPETGRLE